MNLNELKPNQGAKKVPKRKGHGISAGQGKTSGRGTKGQNSRAGEGGHLYRQGGNLPFFRRLPFIRGEGFTPPNQVEYNEVTLDRIAKFPAKSVITPEELAKEGMLHRPGNPIVVLGNGEIKNPVTLKVHRITKSAKAKVEAAGGTVELIV
jgi:large subunit ribosomal protein L15